MRQTTLLLTAVTTALALGTAHFYREYRALAQSVAAGKEQCTQQIAQLKSEHGAQLEKLQQPLVRGQ
ncbi:MAG TPA: hypothetical protein VFX02_10565 [Gammaproteobacteria bacterium]|nr:hypothetical protein [Gammaproteobacteria bacterium]